ncbi:MAG: hypothetical protein LUO95_05205 [Methylococcaceae bacterium]|nr:hypothetical protein [Methylococcaceae bacterium]MDD1610003.1 hypothetical protein [Methylococcaceae bacterium]MDD1615224.1 hypothetical protein [Methylococcaceae bacterium]
MNREFTVLLKQPENPPPSTVKKIWDAFNNIAKSPLIVFLFGAIVSATVIQNIFKSSSELEQEKARADAALIAPFLANLSATEPGKFRASWAALNALEKAFGDEKRPVFVAVNEAINTVATEIESLKPKSGSANDAEAEKISNDKTNPALSPSEDISTYYQKLRNSLIYIQVDKDEKSKQSIANDIQKNLRNNMIIAPGVEEIDSKKIPAKTQVRYFNSSDKEKAEVLASIIKSITKLEVYTVQPNLKAKEGVLEIWIGKE